MKNPIVSIIIPAYNEKDYIKRSIRSVLNQTFNDLEIIVVDDGSSDGTVSVARSIIDPRLRIHFHDRNRGVVNCLNEGISISRGKYIARMDADDMSLPERISKQLRIMEDEPECVMTGTGYYFLNYRDDEYKRIVPVCKDKDIRREMLTHNPVNTGSAFYRKSALENVGGFNLEEQRGEGYSILLKLSQVGKIKNVPDAEYVYFLRSSQLNRSTDKGFRTRNQAMSIMVKRAGELTKSGQKALIASKAWKLYHLLPRSIQILIRKIISDEKHISLNNDEINNIEQLYESLRN